MSNSTTPTSTPCDIDKLFPALVECFVIILLGYGSGRLGLISSSQNKGIGNFVSLFALPALLFKSMAGLNLNVVNWNFLLAILISKGLVFGIVVLLTIILGRPQKYGRAGIYGIFCTQSNDFALGLPLIQALYGKSMPELINYIYLLAPISLVILNPIGFILMEFNKHHGTGHHIEKRHVAMATIKGVVTNPIVFMTFIGIIANFAFKQKVPEILDGFLTVLGSAFFASSLFFLGLKMVGNMKKQMGYGLVVPFLLIFSKLMLLPLCAREIVQLLDVGGTNQTLTDTWSMFGFLYGTIPTAPTVVIFASKFAVEEEKIATSMVLGTFLSAPILYTSAKMISTKFTPQVHTHYHNTIKETIQDSCVVSIPFGLWVIVMLVLGRRYKIFPQRITLWLVLSQVAYAVVSLICDVHPSSVWHWVSFFLVSVTGLLCRCWTAMVPFALCIVRCSYDSMKTLQPWIYSYGVGFPYHFQETNKALNQGLEVLSTDLRPFMLTVPLHFNSMLCLWSPGLPVLLSAIKLCFVNLNQPESDTQSFISYAQNQMPCLIIQVICLGLNLIIIIVSLVMLQRCDRYCKCPTKLRCQSSSLKLAVDSNEENKARCHSCKERQRKGSSSSSVDFNRTCSADVQSTPRPVDIESLDESTCLLSGDVVRYVDNQSNDIEKIENELSLEEYFDGDKHQLAQHVILVLCLAFSICLGLFMCLWYLSDESRESGLFIGMRVLDTIFLFGQGFISFACFGMDKQLIIIPFVKRFRKLIYGADNVVLPKKSELTPEEIHLCEQFIKHHKAKCKRAVNGKKSYGLRTYSNVFSGEELVTWLTDLGLADDRLAATNYGNTLLRGRVIEHVTKKHSFYDLPYFYRFC